MKFIESKLFLKIADFTIELWFEAHEENIVAEKFIKELKLEYSPFIMKEPITVVHYKIVFGSEKYLQIYSKKVKSMNINYVYLYKKINIKKIKTSYQIGLFQFQYILGEVLQQLLKSANGFILHAAAVYHESSASLFLGPEGAGKSTMTHLLGEKYKIIADDSCIIRKGQSGYLFYTSLFMQRNKIDFLAKSGVPVKNIFILEKKSYCKIKIIDNKSKIINIFFGQLWSNERYLKNQISSIIQFINNHNIYYFYFNKNKEEVTKTFGTL